MLSLTCTWMLCWQATSLTNQTDAPNMALYSLFKLSVLCALFQAAAAIECSGTRTPENSPFGVYSNVEPVPVGKMGMEVTTVDLHFDTKTTAANFNSDVTYKQHLVGCLFEQAGGTYECKTGKFPLGPDMNFKNGHFYDTQGTGSKFIPVAKPNLTPFEKFIDGNLKIQWCPEQDWFVVVVAGPDGPVPYKLQSSGPMYVPMAEARAFAYPKVKITDSTAYNVEGEVEYASLFCGDDDWSATPSTKWTASSRGACLVCKITATVKTPRGNIQAKPYKASPCTSYSEFAVIADGSDGFEVTRRVT